MRRIKKYIHSNTKWPNFYWDHKKILSILAKARNLQGKLVGKMESIGFELQNEAVLKTLTLDILKSSEIEGEYLEKKQVRSSIARRLGINITNPIVSERSVDGFVDIMIDATHYYKTPLTAERLFNWHEALFPTGRSGMNRITVADWRKDTDGPMQVVSGAIGKEKIHFQAPSSEFIDEEMKDFLVWFEKKDNNSNNNKDEQIDLVLKAAIAHLWFVTIHPFEDGNGRITRVITDMLLARSDNSIQRFYSMSAQILIERKEYYNVLEKTQKGDLDITNWILWFWNCMINAINSSEIILLNVLSKATFWKLHSTTILNERQNKMINKLFDDFKGKLTSSKWGKITKCSQDTALRDIQDLVKKKILQKEIGGGRSTSYELYDK